MTVVQKRSNNRSTFSQRPGRFTWPVGVAGFAAFDPFTDDTTRLQPFQNLT